MEQQSCARKIRTEFIHVLTRMDELVASYWSNIRDTAIEIISTGRNVEDFGRDISPQETDNSALDGRNDESHCCVCLEPYQAAHTPFEITACRHSVGKACLSAWLNCTSLNPNTCPCCRKELFQRLDLHLAASMAAQFGDPEWFELCIRISKAKRHFERLGELREQLLGHRAAVEFLGCIVHEVNFEFFENDVNYCLEYVSESPQRVGIRIVNWHS